MVLGAERTMGGGREIDLLWSECVLICIFTACDICDICACSVDIFFLENELH